eukprot:c27049_g1_i1 orf=129-1355(+)
MRAMASRLGSHFCGQLHDRAFTTRQHFRTFYPGILCRLEVAENAGLHGHWRRRFRSVSSVGSGIFPVEFCWGSLVQSGGQGTAAISSWRGVWNRGSPKRCLKLQILHSQLVAFGQRKAGVGSLAWRSEEGTLSPIIKAAFTLRERIGKGMATKASQLKVRSGDNEGELDGVKATYDGDGDDDDDGLTMENDGAVDDFSNEEDDDEGNAVIGDGGDGGGVVLGHVDWDKKALEIAEEVLGAFGSDFTIYAFKVSANGCVHVRLDKLSDKYGSPSLDEIENFSTMYGRRLEEAGQESIIPDNLALQVSSPGAERVVQVPNDLLRFKGLPMYVRYVEEKSSDDSEQLPVKDGVLELQSAEMTSGYSVWKIANVRQNRDSAGKGRGLTRKQREWRAQIPFSSLQLVRLYLEV